MKRICQNCHKEFDTADRVSSTAIDGSEVQVKYCSEKCARQAENRRAYQKRKENKCGK